MCGFISRPISLLWSGLRALRVSYLGKTHTQATPKGAHVLLSLLGLHRPTLAHHLHPRRMIGFFYMPTMGWHWGEWNTVKDSEHKLLKHNHSRESNQGPCAPQRGIITTRPTPFPFMWVYVACSQNPGPNVWHGPWKLNFTAGSCNLAGL